MAFGYRLIRRQNIGSFFNRRCSRRHRGRYSSGTILSLVYEKFITRLKPLLAQHLQAPAKRLQHLNATYRNVVGHSMLRAVRNNITILTACRTPVTFELSEMTLLSVSSRSSVDRASARCSGGHGFDSCRGLRFFLCSTFMSC